MISYEPLFKTLKEKNMPMNMLSERIGFAATTLSACISRKENVSSAAIERICQVLNCNISDVVEDIPEGTEVKHKRTAIRAKLAGENLVVVDWTRLGEDISKAGYNSRTLSLALNKAENFIVKKKSLKHITLTTLQEITKVIGTNYQDYI